MGSLRHHLESIPYCWPNSERGLRSDDMPQALAITAEGTISSHAYLGNQRLSVR
jgi:hypothetical protein